MAAAMWLALLFLLWLSPVAPNWETDSCSQPQPLCCPGINNHCKRGSCYCDTFCHVVSDCCPDHHSAPCSPASQNTRMVLQVVLRMENPPNPARSNLNWMQSMVQQFLRTSLPGMPCSISVKGISKGA